MTNNASSFSKISLLMSLDTTGIATYYERMREDERRRWRAQCDETRARREGGGLSVTANFSGGQGRGEGHGYGDSQGDGFGQDSCCR